MSWNLAKGKAFLSGVSLQQLKLLYHEEDSGKAKLRLLAAIHRKQGKRLDFIAESLFLPRTTVHDWLQRFQKRGVAAKNSVKQPGRPTKLTRAQMRGLLNDLEQGPKHNKYGLWTTKEVRDLLKKKYGVSFVPQHVYRIITGLGFTLQRPRKKHYKSASPEDIEEFKKTLDEKPDTTEEEVLLWAHKTRQHSDSSH